MSKDEIKYEISKVLDLISNKAMEDLLSFLRNIESRHNFSAFVGNTLDKILNEDRELLGKLSK